MSGLATAAPTAAHVRHQVEAVLAKVPDARVVGIQVAQPIEVDPRMSVGGREVEVVPCRSVLAMRERLAEHDAGDAPLVLLTDVPENELGADLLARLARGRLFRIEPWQLVKDRFRARHVDPRLVERHGWAAAALLALEPEGELPPAPSGFVDAERVWALLFAGLLGVDEGRRDAEALLEWGLDAAAPARLAALTAEVRDGLVAAAADSGGALAGAVLGTLVRQPGAAAVAVGLAARVLVGAGAGGDRRTVAAEVRLEQEVGAAVAEHGEAWADAAEAVLRRRVRERGPAAATAALAAADALLERIGGPADVAASDFLRSALDRRLERLGAALRSAAAGRGDGAAVWERARAAQRHVLIEHDRHRHERIAMAARLGAWCLEAGREPDAGSGLVELVRRERRDGGFADWARVHLWQGDPSEALTAGLTELAEAARRLREDAAARCAAQLAEWLATDARDAALVPIEEVLDRVVAPLAAHAPVLLLVLDGMGMAVYRQIQHDLVERRGWIEIVQGDAPAVAPPVLAALPSVTEVCRASLLCGELTRGQQRVETAGFARHAALVKASRAGHPPVLFHKDDLRAADREGLPQAVLDAVGGGAVQAVGVVVNAIDDYLDHGDQLRLHWDADHVGPLEQLLEVARQAGRAVVVTSDHGHVLDHRAELRRGDGNDRFRAATSAPGDGERLFRGERVVTTGNSLVAAWSERLRYGHKKHGYHGGASPQEVVVPIGVFVGEARELPGWTEARVDTPAWWLPPEAQPGPAAARPPARRRRRREPAAQQPLFAAAEPAAAPAPSAAAWIERLLATEIYAAQRERAARTRLDDARVRTLLAALDARGGRMTRKALARAAGTSELRLDGMLSALRRVLNVEGFEVIAVDETSGTVTLDRKLAEAQFGV